MPCEKHVDNEKIPHKNGIFISIMDTKSMKMNHVVSLHASINQAKE